MNSIHSFNGVNGWAVGNLGVIISNYTPPTNIENENNIAPNSLLLEQNYPNPFNPSTKISFTLPAREFVTLKVFNVLGSEVAILINDNMEAGLHEITFNASGLNGGVYFYVINTKNFTSTRKMILLK